VLILAAGVPRAFDHRDFAVITVGYAVMRAAQVSQWLRAAHDDPPRRRTNVRYAAGIGACMAGWVALLAAHGTVQLFGFVVMITIELLVPIWAERPAGTTWHPSHIAERYGLFTLIVLGESVASATVAVQSALDAGRALRSLLAIGLGSLLVVFSMWWVYFAQPVEDVVGRARNRFEARSSRASFAWGYGNFVLFAAAAAVGAGLAVATEQATAHTRLSARAAGLSAAIPAAIYLLCVWVFSVGPGGRAGTRWVLPAGAGAVVVAAALGVGVLGTGVLLALTAAGVAVLGAVTPAEPG
jgi:low temperature requirement protein LtrA